MILVYDISSLSESYFITDKDTNLCLKSRLFILSTLM